MTTEIDRTIELSVDGMTCGHASCPLLTCVLPPPYGGPGLGAPHWGMRVATPTALVGDTPLTPIPPRGTIISMSNEHGYHGNTENHLARLRRIEGQVRGLQRMISQGEYCIDILTQVSAVQSALDSVAVNLLKDHMNHCVVTAARESDEAAQAKVDEAAAAIARLIKS